MALAMAWPCAGPSSSVRRINRSRVPCSSSMRSFSSLVVIIGQRNSLLEECQGEEALAVPQLKRPVLRDHVKVAAIVEGLHYACVVVMSVKDSMLCVEQRVIV